MKREQRKRTKGYKSPDNCKYVGRPTKWGNPFKVDELGAKEAVRRYRECILSAIYVYKYFEGFEAVEQFKSFTWISENFHTLKKYDYISCFCNLSEPCHCDALIELNEILP